MGPAQTGSLTLTTKPIGCFFFLRGSLTNQQDFAQKQTRGASRADETGRQEAVDRGRGARSGHGARAGRAHPGAGELGRHFGTLRDARHVQDGVRSVRHQIPEQHGHGRHGGARHRPRAITAHLHPRAKRRAGTAREDGTAWPAWRARTSRTRRPAWRAWRTGTARLTRTPGAKQRWRHQCRHLQHRAKNCFLRGP